MDKQSEPKADNQSMTEAQQPKKSLKQKCIEIGAIPHSKFAQEWIRQLEERFKK